MNLTKFAPSLFPLLIGLATALAPDLQALVAAHPLLATVLGALYAILAHALPSPVAAPSLPAPASPEPPKNRSDA